MNGNDARSALMHERMKPPGLLASVRNHSEAALALHAGVHILDLKDPEHGALGALDKQTIIDIRRWVNGRCPVSATIGDLPPDAKRIAEQTEQWIGTGVDFIKIGFFGGDYIESCSGALQPLAKKARLVAVLFADCFNDTRGVITVLAYVGFAGVMLDTADKSNGSLRCLWSDDKIAAFVNHARASRMLSGVAGSLTDDDIAPLCKIKPDYLGFRTALCESRQRTNALSATAINQVSQKIMRLKLNQAARP